MQLQQEKLNILDCVFNGYLQKAKDLTDLWLFEQTLYTSQTRRLIFQYFPFKPHSCGLDAGTGFGALPLELAGQMPITVHGVDLDQPKLDVAKELQAQLHDLHYFYPGSEVQFHNEDLYSLSFDDGQFDFVISRFVYQHLQNPEAVTNQFYRIMSAEGYICIIDVDDQFSISYPPSEALQMLEKAFADLQSLRGGDRYVGRKISTYLQCAGFEICATVIQPQAQHVLSKPNDISTRFLLNRLNSVKKDIVKNSILDESTFDNYIYQIANQKNMFQFNSNALVIVIAKKPE